MKILYLHNFGEIVRDSHYEALRRLFPDAEISAIEIDYTDKPIFDLVFDFECIRDVDCIVGNGFGGYLAYIVGIANNTKTICINPYIPMTDYLEGVPYIEDNREDMNTLWQNNKGENKDCHILLEAKLQVPDTNKTFEALKDIADINIYCDSETITNSKLYEDWLRRYIS